MFYQLFLVLNNHKEERKKERISSKDNMRQFMTFSNSKKTHSVFLHLFLTQRKPGVNSKTGQRTRIEATTLSHMCVYIQSNCINSHDYVTT